MINSPKFYPTRILRYTVYLEVMKNNPDTGKEPTAKEGKTIEEHFEARTKLSTSTREHKELTKSVHIFYVRIWHQLILWKKVDL